MKRRARFWVGLLGVALMLPAVWSGLEGDDFVHRLVMTKPQAAEQLGLPNRDSPWRFFTFLTGNPADINAMMERGTAPWWAWPGIRSSFLRPVAWMTHKLDYLAWPQSPAAMHLQSLFWYGAALLAAASCYRRVAAGAMAGLAAALLFALDDAHATAAGWIANRNAVLALLFGLLSFLAHDSWRRNRQPLPAVMAPLLLLGGLLCSEGAVAAVGLIIAHALFLDTSEWRRRLASLIPYVTVLAAWRLAWSQLDFGSCGMGLYADPLREPIRYLAALADRAPLVLLSQFAIPPVDVLLALDEAAARLAWWAGLALALVAGLFLMPLLRRDPWVRFWSTALVVALVPCCATVPTERNHLFLSVAGMGLLGHVLSRAVTHRSDSTTRSLGRLGSTSLIAAIVLLHAVWPMVLKPIRASMPMGPPVVTRQLLVDAELPAGVDEQTVVVVSAPSAFHVIYLPILRADQGLPVPAHTRVLGPSFTGLVVRRPDTETLILRTDHGWLAHPGDRIFRGSQHPFEAGDEIQLTGMTATVLSTTADGRPLEVSFRFGRDLGDPSLVWLTWKDDDFRPVELPPVGGEIELATPSLPLPTWRE